MSLPAIKSDGVTKRFGGLTAVNDVNMTVPKGSISSIIGPNGAGKTTLFNCISGFYEPESGQIYFHGQPIGGLPTHRICEMGIARTYQNIRLFKEMTALENVLVGQHVRLSSIWIELVLHNKHFREEEAQAVAMALDLLDFMGLSRLVDTPAFNLPYGAQRRLEITRGSPASLHC